jgi:hypothetical protein
VGSQQLELYRENRQPFEDEPSALGGRVALAPHRRLGLPGKRLPDGHQVFATSSRSDFKGLKSTVITDMCDMAHSATNIC